MFGLSTKDINEIIHVISQFPAVREAVIFGSRAKGNFKTGSDIDIAIKGENVSAVLPQIHFKLEEDTSLPFFFDLIDYSSISNPDLTDQINRVGISLFKR